MSDTFGVTAVACGYRTDIEHRNSLIAGHRAAIAELEAANRTDAGHLAMAELLIGMLEADPRPAAYVGDDMSAALLVADLSAADPSGRARMLAALHDATANVAALDGAQAAGFVHDHAADDCPACLLAGAGDLAVLDRIDAGEVVR